jgi:hypothetical protein
MNPAGMDETKTRFVKRKVSDWTILHVLLVATISVPLWFFANWAYRMLDGSGNRYTVVVTDGKGIEPYFSEVRSQGVLVGRVISVDVNDDRSAGNLKLPAALMGKQFAVVTVSLARRYGFQPLTSAVVVPGLVGASRIEVSELAIDASGSTDRTIPVLASSETLFEAELPSVDKVVKEIPQDIDAATGKLKTEIDTKIVPPLTKVSTSATTLLNKGSAFLDKAGKKIDPLVNDTERWLADFRTRADELLADVRKANIPDKATKISVEVNHLIQRVDTVVDHADKLLTDPKAKEDFEAISAKIRTTTDDIEAIIASWKPDGTNGIALRKAIEKIEAEVDVEKKNLEELIHQGSTVLDSTKSAIDAAKDKIKDLKPSVPKLSGEELMLVDGSRGEGRRLDANVYFDNWQMTTGVFDLFGNARFNLERERALGSGLTARYGMYAGSIGAGLDYVPPGLRNWQFTLDGYRLSDTDLDIGFRYYLGNYFLTSGVDGLFGRNSLFVGAGVKH